MDFSPLLAAGDFDRYYVSLTAIWIFGAGVFVAGMCLLIVWLLSLLLSYVPGLRTLAENRAAAITGVVVGGGLIGWWLYPLFAPLFESSNVFTKAASQNPGQELLTGILFSVAVGLFLAGVVIFLSNRRSASELGGAMFETPMLAMLITGSAVAAIGLTGIAMTYFSGENNPVEIFGSIWRMSRPTEQVETIEAPPKNQGGGAGAEVKVDMELDRNELLFITIETTQDLYVGTQPLQNAVSETTFEVDRTPPDEAPFRWHRGMQAQDPFKEEITKALYVTNLGGEPAKVTIRAYSYVEYPQVIWFFYFSAIALSIALAYLLQRMAFPRITAISLATIKSSLGQLLFWVILILGSFLLALFVLLPYYTLGEDIKMYLDSSFSLITLLALVQALWASGTEIAEEIEGRISLTVLSKPIGRTSYIIGKYLGILWTVVIIFLVLGSVMMICVALKVPYDGRETARADLTWQECFTEMTVVVPGLFLSFLTTAIISAISVAISTRLPTIPNFMICFTIYGLGRLLPLIVDSTAGDFAPVAFFGQFLSIVLPVLHHYDMQPAIAGGQTVPPIILFWSTVYALLYCVMALVLSLLLFEDRDLT
jgi:hypothetical protein